MKSENYLRIFIGNEKKKIETFIFVELLDSYSYDMRQDQVTNTSVANGSFFTNVRKVGDNNMCEAFLICTHLLVQKRSYPTSRK